MPGTGAKLEIGDVLLGGRQTGIEFFEDEDALVNQVLRPGGGGRGDGQNPFVQANGLGVCRYRIADDFPPQNLNSLQLAKVFPGGLRLDSLHQIADRVQHRPGKR